MDTHIAYFDEAGDDGVTTASSSFFVLTSLYMDVKKWQSNFDAIRASRKELRDRYSFHISEELHTKHLLSDKDPYRKYGWSIEQKQNITTVITKCIAELDAQIINVIIDKTKIQKPDYPVLANALTYNIQRIENDSHGNWNYLIISDKGRVGPMRKTARAIRAFNPIQSKYSLGYTNRPINHMIEDILEKDSDESYFIQVCDFVSYIVHLYFKTHYKNEALPNRVAKVIDKGFVGNAMATLKAGGVLNTKASSENEYGLVIYPR